MKKCPLIKKPCVESDCTFWTHLLGTNPNTGQPIDEFCCSIQWTPILLIENARQARGVQAAVESMRNEVVVRQDTLNDLITQASRAAPAMKDVTPDHAKLSGDPATFSPSGK